MEKDSKNKNKLKNLQYMYETKPKKMKNFFSSSRFPGFKIAEIRPS